VEWVFNAYTALVAALLGAIGFLVRKIFTSEQKIAVLEAKLSGLDQIEQDIRELRQDVKDILLKM
jgi:Tfp pilus assembly protein PilN